MSTIETSIGTAQVLHRLALAVETMDPLTDRLVLTPVRVGQELVRRTRATDPRWPCRTFHASGSARFALRHQPSLPTRVVVRVDDPGRRLVPRRFRLRLWPPNRLDRTDTQPYITAAHRLVRLWLWPGVAAAFPSGTTVVRGRLVRDGLPARWARVTARDAAGQVVGQAHGDERGEFVLVVSAQSANPLPRMLTLDLRVEARRVPGPVDPLDRCADLVVERVPRAPRPPTPALLDTPLLRGTAAPTSYRAQIGPDTQVLVTTGTEHTMPGDLVFGLAP